MVHIYFSILFYPLLEILFDITSWERLRVESISNLLVGPGLDHLLTILYCSLHYFTISTNSPQTPTNTIEEI